MAEAQTGFLATLRDLVGAFMPLALGRLEREIEDRVRKVPTPLNDYGFDPYGMHPDWVRRLALPTALVYRYYFRTETIGIENVPSSRVLLIANHAGQLPLDGVMLSSAMLLEADPPRIARAMAEYWLPTLPWIGVSGVRSGALVGTPVNCVAMLEAEECVMVFPEGVRGLNKTFDKRYQLQRFGTGFMRLALETDTPIVPVAIVGSEEQQPGLINLPGVGRLMGMPAFPITPTFPLLGPLGLLPLPVRYHIYFGEPMRFSGDPNDDDATIQRRVDSVRASIEALFERGRSERKGIFL